MVNRIYLAVDIKLSSVIPYANFYCSFFTYLFVNYFNEILSCTIIICDIFFIAIGVIVKLETYSL